MLLKIELWIWLSGALFLLQVTAHIPKFRVLAPQFVCPKDEDTPVDKPEKTIITIQTAAGANLDLQWKVRWTPLIKPSQRFTILLWRAVRALEAKLNAPQPEPFVYVIDNDELLIGVNYQFTICAVEPTGEVRTPKTFLIDNTRGDQKLDDIDGRGDLISIVLLGGQQAYVDVTYVLEAEVTPCFPTQDYYFIWTIMERDTSSQNEVDVSQITGSRLEVPPGSLKPGAEYYVNCQVVKQSTGNRLTQTGLYFAVLHRTLQVYLNVDTLTVTVRQPFTLEATIENHDYPQELVEYKWTCIISEVECDFIESSNNSTLVFSSGLPDTGLYKITVSVNVLDQWASANATVEGVEPTLPVIQISPSPRVLNEGSSVALVANASNVPPKCTLAWYFATEEYLLSEHVLNETCENCPHGEAVSDAITIFSLEENFLNELTDFTNETEWRQVTANLPASAGRARFVAWCECSLTFDCETLGTVYADVSFVLNESPKAREVLITPNSGTAMETIFRISTLAVVDPDAPVKYSFYCQVGNGDQILLQSYVEHLAVETMLPYVAGIRPLLNIGHPQVFPTSTALCHLHSPAPSDLYDAVQHYVTIYLKFSDGGTSVWVEICDVLGACSTSDPVVIGLSKGTAATVNTLIEATRAHVRRCEIIDLRRVVSSAVITYINADQQDALTTFTTVLIETLLSVEPTCVQRQHNAYLEFLQWLNNHGVGGNQQIK